MEPNLLGGYSKPMPADSNVRELLKKVQPDVEAKINGGKRFSVWEAISYRVQIVNGTNYKIKAKTDTGFVECLVYKSLGNQIKLMSIAQGQDATSMY